MKEKIINTIASILPRRTLWRLGRSLYLKARSDTRNIMSSNGEKMVQRAILAHALTSGKEVTIFDIGANVGEWTLSLLKQAVELGCEESIRLYAFEPVPSTFDTLKYNIAAHKKIADLVTLINQALSNKEGLSEMRIVAENAGTNSLYADPRHPTTQRIQVKLNTVDKFCNHYDMERVDFIKCDTEGNDMNVLYGMKELLTSQKVMVVQFEYNHRWIYARHYLKDVFDLVDSQPYMVGKVTPDKVEIYKAWHPELEKFFEGNYLIIHKSALSWFDVSIGDFDVFDTYRSQQQLSRG